MLAQSMAVATTPTPAGAVPVCNGKYKGRLKPSPDELAKILKQHAAWVNSGGWGNPKLANDPRRANLCDADLTGAHLDGADLTNADLTNANLFDADLKHAHLEDVNLEGANLENAHLNKADLSGAHLVGADLANANLDGVNLGVAELIHAILIDANLEDAYLAGAHLNRAILENANLSHADLNDADLTHADLIGAQVTKAKLGYADLTSATYAPASEPPDPYVAGIKGLATINAANGEQIGLIQLRKLLQDAGLRDSEKEATFSIQRNVTRDQLSRYSPHFALIKGCLRTVGFEWTTAYGLHPTRALRWILLLGTVLTPVYMFAILRPTAASGVMQVFPADRLREPPVILLTRRSGRNNSSTQKVGAPRFKPPPPSRSSRRSILVSNSSPQATGFAAYKLANILSKRSVGYGSSLAAKR